MPEELMLPGLSNNFVSILSTNFCSRIIILLKQKQALII